MRQTRWTIAALSAALLFASALPVSASQTNGTIDSVNKSARICKNTACSSFGSLNWKPTGGTAVAITDSGLSGHVWGDEIGWIKLAPTGSGVTINSTTGALSGYAFSQTGSWINFNPTDISGGTNVGVTINSSGQFTGWAWVSGIGGGWMKFDCASSATCVTTDWRPTGSRTASTASVPLGGGSPGSFGGSFGSSAGAAAVNPAPGTEAETGVSRETTGVVATFAESRTTTSEEPAPGFPEISTELRTVLESLGIETAPLPGTQDIYAVNAPLVVTPDQTGTLVHEFPGGLGIVVETPRGTLLGSSFSVAVSTTPPAGFTLGSAAPIVGSAVFNIVMSDGEGNPIHSLDVPVTITLVVPEVLRGRDDLGVYWLDETANEWTLVPGTEFGDGTARFSVDHLTLFAIFSATGLPSHISNTPPSVIFLSTPSKKGTLLSLLILFAAVVSIRKFLKQSGR